MSGGVGDDDADNGASGTIYPEVFSCDLGTLSGTCTINSTKNLANGVSITGSGNIVIASGGNLVTNAGEAISIDIDGDFTIDAGVTVTANLSNLEATNITINGDINVNGLGYTGVVGTDGNGPCPGLERGSGGGHGGHGGIARYGEQGGVLCGSLIAPVDYGSAGGGWGALAGGNGGGKVRLTASGAIAIAGNIFADGADGTGNGSIGTGGGAGGSIYLESATLTGAGNVYARGGDGGDEAAGTEAGAGGGGGRIAFINPSGSMVSGAKLVSGGSEGASVASWVTGGNLGTIFQKNTPGLCDSGTLASGDTCVISSAVAISNTYFFGGDGNITFTTGASVTGSAYQYGGFYSGGNIVFENNVGATANVFLQAAGDISICAGCTLDARDKGFQGPATDGNGLGSVYGYGNSPSNHDGGGGGAHGGKGGAGKNGSGTGGNAYGNGAFPMSLGSSGAGAGTDGDGGNGGGFIGLIAGGNLTLDGTLNVDGGDAGIPSADNQGGGGGAGGSVYLSITGTISGGGTITAKGGKGGGNSGDNGGGAGGGGRIAIYGGTPFLGTIDLSGGALADNFNSLTTDGLEGSFYTNYTNPCDSGSLSGTCTITTSLNLGDGGVGSSLSGSGSLVIDGATLSNVVDEHAIAIDMDGDITLINSAVIAANLGEVEATNFNLSSNSSINAKGKGFRGGGALRDGSGDGSGERAAGNDGGGGGAHGGDGGNGRSFGGTTGHGGSSYGSATAPATFGSGGGAGNEIGDEGGHGGGRVLINITGTATIDGTIDVSGNDAPSAAVNNEGAGGGAGGSIYISAATGFAGMGNIYANGGKGGGDSSDAAGGGGGGGRIALVGGTPFHGSVSLNGGLPGDNAANDIEAGASGSFYTNYTNPCDTGTLSGTCTITNGFKIGEATHGSIITGTGSLVIDGTTLSPAHKDQVMNIVMNGDITIQNSSTDTRISIIRKERTGPSSSSLVTYGISLVSTLNVNAS